MIRILCYGFCVLRIEQWGTNASFVLPQALVPVHVFAVGCSVFMCEYALLHSGVRTQV